MSTGFKKATVNASSVPSTQTSFPAYVDLSRLGITTLAEAQSVRVYADESKTTEWAREIVSVKEMHVKVPSLTSTVDIYVDWDGSSADYGVTDTYGRNAVWSDYLAVYHMQGTNGTSEKKIDATGNSRNLTETNGPEPEADDIFSVDGAYSLYGLAGSTSSTTTYDYISAPTILTTIGSNAFTFSIWINLNVQATVGYSVMRQEEQNAYGKPSAGMSIDTSNYPSFGYAPTTGTFYSSGAAGRALSLNTWEHIIGKKRSDTYPEIKVGASNTSTGGTGTGTAFGSLTAKLEINRRYNSTYSSSSRYADCQVGEARMKIGATSDDWDTTEYNNQSDEAGFWGTWSDVGGGPTANNSARRLHMMMM